MVRIRANKARRQAHIRFVQAHPELRIGGELAIEPQQDFPGAIWHVRADSLGEVEELVRSDPYFIPSLRRFLIQDAGRIFAENDAHL